MRQDNIIIRRETPADYAAVEHLTREAFWNVYRPGCLEHFVVHVLREDPDFVPELDLVMERDGALIGHVLYMRAKIVAADGREVPMMTFGPISIRPDLQRQGLGPVHRGQHRLLREVRLCGGRDKGDPLPRGAGAGSRSLCSAEGTPARFSGRCYRHLLYAQGLLCGRGRGGGI